MATDSLRRIDAVLGRVNTHPEYSSSVAKEVNHQLRTDAERHSLDIEFRGSGFNFKNHIGLTKRTFGRLRDAWNYLANYGIDAHSISKLGYLIEPETNGNDGFRKSEVQFGGFAPPAPTDVPSLIENLVSSLDNPHFHAVERASHAHLEMVRIHPYLDGNGRAARILSDFCLQQKGYPVAVIPSCDRGIYMTLISKALKDRYSHQSSYHEPSDAESSFIEFIASKVLHSAEFLEKELISRRIYEITLKNLKSPGIVHSVAKVIRGTSNRPRNRGVTVNVNKKKHRKAGEMLRVMGDISAEELRKSLDSLSAEYGFGYAVSPQTGC